jgi:hypothetical protein
MATTTNYGWTTPDDTALVKDGAAAIRTLGSSVDTTTKALNPSTTLGDIEYRSSTANTNTRLGIGSTGNVLTVAGGVPTWAAPAGGATFAGCSLTMSGDQTISNGAWTKVNWDTETFDTDAYHSTSTNTSRITIPSGKAGYYQVNAFTQWSVFAEAVIGIGIYINNVRIHGPTVTKTNNFRGFYNMPQIVNVAVSDYIEIAVFQESGASQDLRGDAWASKPTFVSVGYLGA